MGTINISRINELDGYSLKKIRITHDKQMYWGSSDNIYEAGTHTFSASDYPSAVSYGYYMSCNYTVEYLGTTFGPIDAGLPNITGNDQGRIKHSGEGDSTSGAFYQSNWSATIKSIGSGSNYGHLRCTFDASRCSSIYKNTVTTVTPKSYAALFYIRY